MPRFRQPPRTIPGPTVTADRITFPLDDINDPRYRAYQDSLYLYNKGKREYEEDALKMKEDHVKMLTSFLDNDLRPEARSGIEEQLSLIASGEIRPFNYEENTWPIKEIENKPLGNGREHYEVKLEGIDYSLSHYEGDEERFKFNKTIKPAYGRPIGQGGVRLVYKKPTYPMVTKELRPLDANPMTSINPTEVSMREYPYEHTSQNWGRHWKSTSGQAAPKGGGSYFLNRRSDGSSDLLTPQEHENVLRTTQQRPTIRFRNGGFIPNLDNRLPDYDMTRALELGYGADSTGHFPSRDYLTGRILKTPFHPTFKQTIEQDRGQGYRPFLGKDGRVYTISPSDIPKQGPFAPKFRNGGVVPRNNAEQLRPNVEINQRGPIAINPNFRQRSDDRTFSLPRETRERIFRSVEPNNYPKRELKKAALRYFKNQSYDLERNEGTPVTVVDNDAWAFFMGLGQKNNSVSRSAYVPTNAKDKNAKYFTLRNAYPDFDKKVLIDADDVFSDPDKIRLSPRGDFDNKMKVSDDNNTITGVRSRFYPLERVTYSRGEDERGKYYSIYDIYDFKVPFQKKIGQPYEVYDRTYYRDYGDGRNRVMYYNDNELLNFDPNKKNYSVLNLQEELYNRGYPLNSSLKEDGTFDGVLGPEVINALLDWRKQQQTQ